MLLRRKEKHGKSDNAGIFPFGFEDNSLRQKKKKYNFKGVNEIWFPIEFELKGEQ